ncbi:MAG: hypothetical protein AAF892_05185 [Cyanobacteria bacterium P01_D01_bin.71]
MSGLKNFGSAFSNWLDHSRRTEELLSYLAEYTRTSLPEQKRLIIFAQGRTGSNLLENLLVSTGYFRKNGEKLNTQYKQEIRFPISYLSGLSKLRPQRHFICRVKPYHLTEDRKNPVDPVRFLQALSDRGWQMVYLKRENKVMHALSNLIAEARSGYHKFDDQREHLTITVDCMYFSQWVEKRLHFEQVEEEVLTHFQDYESVVYEDDLEKPAAHPATVARVLDFLELERRPAIAINKKINTLALPELITNYDEFIDCVYRSNWQKYLPESDRMQKAR